jgi:hypothetical protein
MTDRELLLSLRSQIDAQLNPAPWPGPEVPPGPTPTPTPPTTPSGNYNGVLSVAGEHFPVPQGPSLWSIPGRTANFAISISGSYAPVTVTILDPAGNVAQQPWGGPASQTFPAGAGEQWAAVSVVGDYSVQVELTKASGQDTINLRT